MEKFSGFETLNCIIYKDNNINNKNSSAVIVMSFYKFAKNAKLIKVNNTN